jgi:hypothetical protein
MPSGSSRMGRQFRGRMECWRKVMCHAGSLSGRSTCVISALARNPHIAVYAEHRPSVELNA